MNEETKDALRELRRRIAIQRKGWLTMTDDYGQGMEHAFSLTLIEIDRMLDKEND